MSWRLIVARPGGCCSSRCAMYPRRLGAWRTEAFRNRPVAAPFRSEVSHWVEGRMRGRMVLACLQDFASERSDMKSLKPKNTERNHGAYCCLARRAMYPHRLGAWRTGAFRNRPVVAPFRSEIPHWVENRMRGRMVLACLRDFASERSDMKSHKPKNTGRNHHLVGYSHAEAQRTRRFVPAERSTRMATDKANLVYDMINRIFM